MSLGSSGRFLQDSIMAALTRLAWLMHTAPLSSVLPYLSFNRRATWQEGTQDVWVDYRVADLGKPPQLHLGLTARGRREKGTSQVKQGSSESELAKREEPPDEIWPVTSVCVWGGGWEGFGKLPQLHPMFEKQWLNLALFRLAAWKRRVGRNWMG